MKKRVFVSTSSCSQIRITEPNGVHTEALPAGAGHPGLRRRGISLSPHIWARPREVKSYRSAGVAAFAAAGFEVADPFVAVAFEANTLVVVAPVGLAAPGFNVALDAVAPVALAAAGFEVADALAPVDFSTPGLGVVDALDTVLVYSTS